MKKYLIENMGCDDSTRFEIELTDEELKTIIRFIKANNQCQPTIDIYNKYFYNDEGKPTTYKQITETTKPMELDD